MGRQVIPLSQRRGDLLLIAFFLLNLCFITYIVDFEQLVIPDPTHFTYPYWPPAPFVDLVHWWGRTFDPLLMARPVWWKVTILVGIRLGRSPHPFTRGANAADLRSLAPGRAPQPQPHESIP